MTDTKGCRRRIAEFLVTYNGSGVIDNISPRYDGACWATRPAVVKAWRNSTILAGLPLRWWCGLAYLEQPPHGFRPIGARVANR